jgi:hypothetical protein
MRILYYIVTFLLPLILIYQYPVQTISPGQNLAGHQKIAADCLSCHQPFLGSRQEKCIVCHVPEKIGLHDADAPAETAPVQRPLFHARLGDTDCSNCHIEHTGSGLDVKKPGFAHELLGKPDNLNCIECHAGSRINDQIHQGASDNCAACHSVSGWKPATFEHDRYFRFDRKHRTTCETCHTQPGNFKQYTCYGCHEHSERKIASEHREEGIRDFQDCARCHRSANEHEAKRMMRNERKTNRKYESPHHDDDDDD